MEGTTALPFIPDHVLDAIAAAAPAHDRDASFPADSLVTLHEAGVLALTVPARLGGGGAGLRAAAQAVAAVGGACASTGLILAMQLIHQHSIATSDGFSQAIRDRIGRDAVETGGLVNALRVEPVLGTPARGGLPETVARRNGGDWRVTGHKIYSTGAPGLRWMLLWARTDEVKPRTGAFAVPADSPGVAVRETWDHLGLRASGSHDVLLDDVAIPLDYAGELRPNEDWRTIDRVGHIWSIVLIGALYTAVAWASRDWLIGFLHDRRPASLKAPLSSLPRVQETVGAIEVKLVVNETLLAVAIAGAESGGPPFGVELNLFKATMTENAVRTVEQAASLAGNHALSRSNPLERHWRDVLCARVHTPQIDSIHLVAGRAALAL
jgi:alkylation response protein AidB-like acyl-CoA dehydrogenase